MESFETFSGFSKTEYLVTFLAIIIGYISSEYFKGAGLLYRRRKDMIFSVSYFLFTFNSFIIITILWWDFYQRSLTLAESMINLLISLAYLLFFYILTIILFRDIRKMHPIDLEKYFRSKKKILFSLVAGFLVFDQLATLKNSLDPFLFLGIALCISGVLINNSLYIKTLLTSCTLLILFYQFREVGLSETNTVINQKVSVFSKAEHLTIFISIIYAYVVTIYFKGWSYLLKDIRKIKKVFIPFLWSIFSFLLLITVWWNTWIRSNLITQEIYYFQISLLPPLFLFIISLIIFPGKKRMKDFDQNTYFTTHRIHFFSAFILFFFFNLLISILFGELDITGPTNIFRAIAIIVAILGLLIKNRYFHRILPFIAFTLLITYIIFYH